MKKVLITIAAVLTLMSCSKEEMIETQDEVNFNFTQAFTGEYLNSEVFIDGELSDTCDTTWDFNDNNTMRIDRVLPCVDGTASSGLSQFTFDIDNLYLTMGGNTASYPYTEDANGNLTLTLLTGDFTITYKLTR